MVNSNNKDIELFLVDAERLEEVGNYKMAAHALRRGAAEGNILCQINLGNYYAAGTGVRKNLKKAAYWYRKAYQNGSRFGAFNLAIDKRDLGDFRSAEGWFRKAVAMRDGSAHLELAKMYIARNRNTRVAAELLRRATKMSADDVSEEEKAEAEALLEEIRSSLSGKRKKKSGRPNPSPEAPKPPMRKSTARRTKT